MKIYYTIILVVITTLHLEAQNIYLCKDGRVDFISDAPLELIKASSNEMLGAINIDDRTFSFRVRTRSFEGFNSSLQKTHFNEDYMESDQYPNSTFSGKIIEEIDLSVPGTYNIRAKGKLTIHGVGIDRIIRCQVFVGNPGIDVRSGFPVFLDDQRISIPTILNQKISEEIQVKVNLSLKPQQ
ncbi:MAG: YceI family protein [Bacteroidales bacterium]